MSEEAKGVFVQLPLSEEQIMKLYNPKKSGNENLLAIGTPVTGKNLDCAVIIEQDDKRYMPEVMSYQPHLVKPKQQLYLVRQSDAQAQIAALDAEVVRLREENERLHRLAHSGKGSVTQVIHSPTRFMEPALKGGAA